MGLQSGRNGLVYLAAAEERMVRSTCKARLMERHDESGFRGFAKRKRKARSQDERNQVSFQGSGKSGLHW